MTDAGRRVLLVTRNLPPVIGGMERLIGQVADTLCAQYETVVVGPRGAKLQRQPTAYYGCPLAPPVRFLAAATLQARRAAKRHRPELVFAGSGLTAPIARLAARRVGARYAVYLHGLDIATPHPLYRRVFVPAVRSADLVLANSRYTARRAREAGVPETRIRILHPGVELPASIPDHAQAAQRLRERYGLPQGPILLGVGRLTPRKGFADFVAGSLPAILEKVPTAQFVIAGDVPRRATQRIGDEAATIRRAATAASIAERVHLIGPLDDADLALTWSAAAAHVFPVRDDPADPEGFGMVALEAAAWGVPTVAYAAGGVGDAVADGQSGRLVRAGNPTAFAAAVIETLARAETLHDSCIEFAKSFSWPRFNSALVEQLNTCFTKPTA